MRRVLSVDGKRFPGTRGRLPADFQALIGPSKLSVCGDESRVDLQNVAKLDNCFLKFAFIEIPAAVLEVT